MSCNRLAVIIIHQQRVTLCQNTKLLLSLWSCEKIQEQLDNHSIRNKVIYDKNGSKCHEEKFQANRVQTKAFRKEIQNV